jgi:hypothetical protein
MLVSMQQRTAAIIAKSYLVYKERCEMTRRKWKVGSGHEDLRESAFSFLNPAVPMRITLGPSPHFVCGWPLLRLKAQLTTAGNTWR